MISKATKIPGIFIIEPELFADDRGFFARSWSERELAELGLESRFIEGNTSFNKQAGTLRGMHYQAAPYGQAKLIRCTRGSIYDVGVDIRKDSETFGRWIGIELSAENRLMLYLPGEIAHGYLTLEHNSEVYYQVTQVYSSESSRGFRWNDPMFRIEWPPLEPLKINQRDREYPDFKL